MQLSGLFWGVGGDGGASSRSVISRGVQFITVRFTTNQNLDSYFSSNDHGGSRLTAVIISREKSIQLQPPKCGNASFS